MGGHSLESSAILYGGSNNQIVLQATQIQDSRNAGYNLAYGIAEMSLSIGN